MFKFFNNFFVTKKEYTVLINELTKRKDYIQDLEYELYELRANQIVQIVS